MQELEKYYSLKYDEKEDIVELIWHEASEEIDDDIFFNIQRAYNKMLVGNKAKKTMIDLRGLLFAIRPSLQEEVSAELYPKAIAAGLCRVAIINSPELITQLSAEQLMEEDESGTFITHYFDNEDSARDWLISQDV
jgi:hypothetical protein